MRALLSTLLLMVPGALIQAQIAPGVIGGLMGGLMAPYMMVAGGPAFSPQRFVIDSLRLDEKALDTLAAKLGAFPTRRQPNEICYQKRAVGRTAYDFCLEVTWPRAYKDTILIDTADWSVDTLTLKKNRMIGIYRFWVETRDDYRVNRSLAMFLESAYHQQLFPDYRARDSLFQAPSDMTQWGLWSRGTVSFGWGADYALHRNPFTGGPRGFVTGMLYVFDGVFCIAAVAMAAGSDSPGEAAQKVLITEAVHTGFAYCLWLPLLSLEIGQTIRLRESGYRFPRELRMD
jgi:hypothetical protein